MPKNKKILKILGGEFKDKRGVLKFFNTFPADRIKRFYIIEKSPLWEVRAFHGHLKEEKFVLVLSGKIMLCLVKINKIPTPSRKNKVHKFILSEKDNTVVHIPKGFANGLKFLEKNTKVMFFSTLKLEDSLKDDYRLPYDYWGDKIWKI